MPLSDDQIELLETYLDGELTDETESDHARRLSELRLGAPHALQRDRANRRRRGPDSGQACAASPPPARAPSRAAPAK